MRVSRVPKDIAATSSRRCSTSAGSLNSLFLLGIALGYRLAQRRYRRTSGDGPPACDQRAEADLVDLDALLTAQYLVQGSFFLNFGLQKRRIATRPIGG
jgi:hypothetical protein